MAKSKKQGPPISPKAGQQPIKKSSNHAHIIGIFGEQFLCNWLSRSGFEVAIVGHTGIDVIAYDRNSQQRLGITVKSRTRNVGKETSQVNLLSRRGNKKDREKVLSACESFGCDPWIAVYVETGDYADLYLTSLAHYDTEYRGRTDKLIDVWRMGPRDTMRYEQDPEVKHVRANFSVTNWSLADLN